MEKSLLKIFTDGGSRGNPGPSAIGFIVEDKAGKILIKKGKYIGIATNNVAEYTAVIEALKWIKKNLQVVKMRKCQVRIFLDSQLVVKQLNGYFKIKDTKLRNLIIKVRYLEAEIKMPVSYHFIPRNLNTQADLLLNQVLNQKHSSSAQ
jgi:ribonuclease HI